MFANFLNSFKNKTTVIAAPRPSNFVPLRFHNTLSGQIEPFVPLVDGEVKMYNCGPTVYDEQHIGNMFSQIFANTLRRALEAWNFKVTQVVNITDVGHLTGDNVGDADSGEDRMEAAAKKTGVSAHEIAEKITEIYFKDLDSLGVDRSKIQFPRATEYIAEQIALVQTLEEKGYAYVIKDGVYFDTKKFSTYGALGNINLAGQEEGARVEAIAEKRNPTDFALWKISDPAQKRQQEWDSPWGVGFPGWHIECTAMIFKLLGKQIDIHTGGIEHIPVHHNNEIAQAETISGRKYVNYWMHNAHITIEGKKISKSVGNTVYLHQIIDRGFSPRAFRLWALTGHYRTPMNFTWDAIEGANTALQRLTKYFFEDLKKSQGKEYTSTFIKDFRDAIANDLDTAKAIALMWEFIKNDSFNPQHKRDGLLFADSILGLGFTEAGQAKKVAVLPHAELPPAVKDLMEQRKVARDAKDFEKSDDIRKRLEALGYIVKDTGAEPEVTLK
jgi:cysteinyl-tRNA synthetase